MSPIRGSQLGILGGSPEGGRSVEIDMLQIAEREGVCGEHCNDCAAFTPVCSGTQVHLTREQLLRNLINPVDDVERSDEEIAEYKAKMAEFAQRGEREARLVQEIAVVRQGVRQRVTANYMAPYLDPDIYSEPTASSSFCDAAELVYGVTLGETRMNAIFHGCRQRIGFVAEHRHVVEKVLAMCYSKVKLNEKGEVESRIVVEAEEREDLEEVISGLIEKGIIDEVLASRLWKALDRDGEMLGTRFAAVDAFLKYGYMEMKARDRDDEAESNLKRMVELADAGVIPLLVLSVNFSRSYGSISAESNLYSYVRTVNTLKPLLAKIVEARGSGQDLDVRVVVSIQGDDNCLSPNAKQKADRLIKHIASRCNLTEKEWGVLIFDRTRPTIKAGMAKKNLPWVDDKAACDVNPYAKANQKIAERRHSKENPIHLRARLCSNGTVQFQTWEDGKTYNTTADDSLWETFVDVLPVEVVQDDSRTETLKIVAGGGLDADVNWDEEIGTDSRIFEISPFDLIAESDRDGFLRELKTVFGKSITELEIEEDGIYRKLKFSDLKFIVLRALLPRDEVERYMHEHSVETFEAEHKLALHRIGVAHTAYRETLALLAKSGRSASPDFTKEAHFSGEVEALGDLLRERGYINGKKEEDPESFRAVFGDKVS